MSRIPVVVVGATGLAGQQFLASLAGHPLFEIKKLAASSRSAGKTFAQAVLTHALREESTEFPLLREHLDADKRAKAEKQLLMAEKTAPTHPHPTAAGSTTAQVLTGPFAAMVDRVKDAMSR